jgi:hypothetical protein
VAAAFLRHRRIGRTLPIHPPFCLGRHLLPDCRLARLHGRRLRRHSSERVVRRAIRRPPRRLLWLFAEVKQVVRLRGVHRWLPPPYGIPAPRRVHGGLPLGPTGTAEQVQHVTAPRRLRRRLPLPRRWPLLLLLVPGRRLRGRGDGSKGIKNVIVGSRRTAAARIRRAFEATRRPPDRAVTAAKGSKTSSLRVGLAACGFGCCLAGGCWRPANTTFHWPTSSRCAGSCTQSWRATRQSGGSGPGGRRRRESGEHLRPPDRAQLRKPATMLRMNRQPAPPDSPAPSIALEDPELGRSESPFRGRRRR